MPKRKHTVGSGLGKMSFFFKVEKHNLQPQVGHVLGKYVDVGNLEADFLKNYSCVQVPLSLQVLLRDQIFHSDN